MKHFSIHINNATILLVLLLMATGCKKKDYALPVSKDVLQNDAIKRTLGPNIVGEPIELVYAMAILPSKGKLLSAQVIASIPGAAGTYLEHRSFFTNGSGVDEGIVVANPSTTTKELTTVTFNKDTSAATLRYYYIVPEEARGKSVSFKFSVKSSNGEEATYDLGPYTLAKMSLVRNQAVSDNNMAYISLADMKVYNAADAAANADKIDLVYLYRNLTTSTFAHAIVAPAADPDYLPGVTLPVGVNRNCKIRKAFSLPDYNLSGLRGAIFIDDIDFQQLNISDAANYGINMKEESGAWVETGDGKYRAYVYFNSVNNTGKSAVIGIKRYDLK